MVLDVDQAKVLAMLVLGGGSFFVGMLPGYMNRRYQRHQLLITFLLCLGAGVLLATSIVHILTEAQKSLPDSAAIYFCGGFFLVYLVDVIVHYFGVEVPGHSHAAHSGQSSRSNSTGSYGAVDSERESLLGPSTAATEPRPAAMPSSPVQCANSSATGKVGLLCALSLHSFLEGLAIGVQDTSSKVLLLITAVACHKYVVGFCLGLEVSEGNANRTSALRALLVSMLIFSLGSVFGIALGMVLVDYKDLWSSSTIPVLQAVAGGTLLYVTLSEVLPREKAKYHQRSRSINAIQFTACLLGFTLMAIMNTYLSEYKGAGEGEQTINGFNFYRFR